MQTGALILTFMVIVWYAWETNKLRRESEQQTKLQISPYLTIAGLYSTISKNVIGYVQFKLYNVGNGAAVSIQLSLSECKYDDGYVKYRRPQALKAGELTDEQRFEAHLTSDRTTLEILFKDVLGKRYRQRIEFDARERKITAHGEPEVIVDGPERGRIQVSDFVKAQ